MVNCETVEDEKCEDVTVGYTTTKQCQKWPRQQCNLEKKTTTKYTTMTGCNKEPTELCAPKGCGFKEVGKIFFRSRSFSLMYLLLGTRGVPRRDQDRGEREARGGVSDRAPEELQTRDQAGAQTPGQATV